MGKSGPESQEGSVGKKHRLENSNDAKPTVEEQMLSQTVSKKPRRDPVTESEDPNDSSSESDSGSEIDMGEDEEEMEEGETPENLVVDFEGIPPTPDDVGSVEALVGQVYRGLPVNSLNISRLIVENEYLSTLLKDQDTDDPSTYAVCSVINLSHPTPGLNLDLALEFREMVKQGIESFFEREDIDNDIPEVLQNFEISTEKSPPNTFGLVVIEKVVNIPSVAVWQLFTTLKEDMDYENQQFTHFFLMTKMYRVEGEVFPFEDYYETFQNVSSLTVDFPLPKDTDTIPHNGSVGTPFRRLLVIPASGFYQATAVTIAN